MRIAGAAQLDARHEDVLVGYIDGKPQFLRINAPKIGLSERVRADLPVPKIPRSGPPARKPGGDFIHNPDGSPVMQENPSDPKYLQALEDRMVLITIALIYECLDRGAGPGQVEFESVRGKGEPGADFYARIMDEFNKAGLTWSSVKALEEAVGRLGEITKEEIKAAGKLLQAEDSKGRPTQPSSTGA